MLGSGGNRKKDILQGIELKKLSLDQVKGMPRIGIINSLGIRREAASLRALTGLAKDKDVRTAAAAIAAIGEIGSPQAAAILRAFQQRASASLDRTLTDSSLVCAERLLAAGQKGAAGRLYQSLNRPEQPPLIRAAVQRGMRLVEKTTNGKFGA